VWHTWLYDVAYSGSTNVGFSYVAECFLIRLTFRRKTNKTLFFFALWDENGDVDVDGDVDRSKKHERHWQATANKIYKVEKLA